MKKLMFFAMCIMAFISPAKAQYVNIPDSNFRNFLRYHYPGCFNETGMLDTTCSEIVNEDTLEFHIYYVSDIDALKYFKRLRYLDCSGNGGGNLQHLLVPDSLTYFNCSGISSLAELPSLPQTLQYLICSYLYDLTALPSLPLTLKYLDCNNCFRLNSIPDLPASLKNFNCSLCSAVSGLPTLPLFLDSLNCSSCAITAIPALPPAISYLNCAENPIFTLPAFPDRLTYIDCSGFGNLFYDDTTTVTLPPLPPSLIYLDCSYKKIKVMPTLPSNLITLSARGNSLELLPEIPNSLLKLDFYGSHISVLPSLPHKLRYLDCAGNPIHNISELPDSLRSLYCYSDSLISLTQLPAQLDTLYCSNNRLAVLPDLPGHLVFLECSNNQLTALPALPNILQYLHCSTNRLTLLPELPTYLRDVSCEWNDIYCLPKLPNSGMGFNLSIDAYHIKCIPNVPQYLSLNVIDTSYLGNHDNVIPLCNPTNNSNHCESFPIMTGTIFYDNNSNGIRDAGEPVKKYNKVLLANNNYSFTNNSGYYEIGADSIGSYTLTAVAPRYFNLVPAAYSYNFINYDTLVTNNFALQANTVIDSLTLQTSEGMRARPGFWYSYNIRYENAGTTTLSPVIAFNYDNTILTYDSSSNPAVISNGGALSLSPGNIVPGDEGSFIAYFTVKPTAVIGDTFSARVSLTAGANNYTESILSTVRGSFDPNDKQATPELSPSQVAAGKYIDYTIHFQNTGTDTAFNIVLSDTLSSDLQASTLQMLNSSHSCKATVKDNVVFFEFLNILLPDSNVNESKSHGFVSFRIKPQSNVAVNTVIHNKAAIYFDYNTPVITNTATTEIKIPLVPVPLKLQSFTAVKQTENTATVTWNTSNEINTAKFNIEQSFDGRSFITIAIENAKGKQYNSYTNQVNIPAVDILYFRLKMIDIDGRFTYSPIVALRKNRLGNPFTILNNPAKDRLNISMEEAGLKNTVARIINSEGAIVETIYLKNYLETIDISKLAAGIYILQTEKGNRQFVVIK